MANCVDTLEAILGSAECKLDSIIYQLEHKLSDLDTDYNVNNDCEPILLNCVQMFTTFKEIQNDLQEIRREHKEVLELQNQMNDKLMDKCKQIEQNVQQLKQKVNFD